MQVQMVAFSTHKDGNGPEEWEDGVVTGQNSARARFIVLDGATEAYDVRRWVDQLGGAFIGLDRSGASRAPKLDPKGMGAWFAAMQDQWAASVPESGDAIEQEKLRRHGAFATMLGCEITGLNEQAPSWKAVALGDTVLFHVRGDRLLSVFPKLGPGDFDTTPEVVHTKRASLERMNSRLAFSRGDLKAGDLMFAATDALAHWIITSAANRQQGLWRRLATLWPAEFDELIAAERQLGRMVNDDVTLLRVHVVARRPSVVLICR
jgi:hypothetical protein